MMRKTKVWAWLTMLCMFFVMAVAVACTNGNKDDSSSSAAAEITLDKTTLELDLHESMQLMATKRTRSRRLSGRVRRPPSPRSRTGWSSL